MTEHLRIAVIGSGAIGLYYGGKLAASGSDVHFLVRSGLSTIQEKGVHIHGPGENIRLPKINSYGSTPDIGACDLVLIAVKATSNFDLLGLIPPLLHEGTALLSLQNGLGNEEFLAEHFGKERVLGGLCFICLNRVSASEVERYDHGHIHIGEYHRQPEKRTHKITEEFQRAGVQGRVVENLALERWRKLVWNIPFNGLSIIAGGIDTAAILADDNLRRSTLDLMEEVIAAANKCGFPLEKSAAQEQMRRTETMGAYKPSTLLDFEAGRPLEIEPIWGEPFRRAQAAGATTPRLQLIYSILQSLDRVRQRTARP
jgi:2-dehydropantoate 2-reductase